MKCSHCGGNLTLKDEYCPHCGQLNEQSARHIRDMKRYEGQFNETKQSVWSRLWKYQGVSVRVVVLAVTAILIIAVRAVDENVYSIERSLADSRASRNVTANIEQINAYLETEDYIDLYYFMNENRLYWNDAYEAYIPLYNAAAEYGTVYWELMLFATQDDQDDYLNNLGGYLENFYQDTDVSGLEDYEGADTEQMRQALTDMREKISALLITYCGLTEEETGQFPTMNSAQRTVLLSERSAE